MRHPGDALYPDAEVIRVVSDNANTHAFGSRFAAFPPDEARRLRRRSEFRVTPRHASGWDRAECEWSVLAGPCRNRRIGSREELAAEVGARVVARSAVGAKIEWTFRVADARTKRDHLDPTELVR